MLWKTKNDSMNFSNDFLLEKYQTLYVAINDLCVQASAKK